MKRCPECNSVFEDSLIYCTHDGELLIEEIFVLPSETSQEIEEETVIHHAPIKVEIPTVAVSPEQIPVETKVVPVIIETSVNRSKYFFYWSLGLLFGVILASGILFFIFFNPRNNSNNQTTSETVQTPNNKHLERNQTRKDSEFNGFVLSENANIRSAPSSSVVESLPKNDRLNILERDGAWYRVICEHGVNGWMHGNTIRFNDDAATF